jgi:hypothetical protein
MPYSRSSNLLIHSMSPFYRGQVLIRRHFHQPEEVDIRQLKVEVYVFKIAVLKAQRLGLASKRF